MERTHRQHKPALHYLISVERIPAKGLSVTIEADERERKALAESHGLEKVESFQAEFHLAPWKKHGVRVLGSIRAAITQSCVVTLAPLDTVIQAPIEAVFVPEGSRLARIDEDDAGELVLDPEGPDMPETFSGHMLDMGAVAEEFFELAIDPYPRKEGAELPDEVGRSEEEKEASPSTFSALAAWKSKQ